MQTINTPVVLEASLPGTLDDPQVVIRTTLSRSEGRYVAMSVNVQHPMRHIRSVEMRHVPVRRLIADGLRTELLAANPDLSKIPSCQIWAKGPSTRARRAAKAVVEHPSDAVLDEARTILKLERLVGGFPVRALERCLGIDYATAKKWARRLR